MSDERSGLREEDGSRRARFETRHADADLVAAAVAPDNTASMATTVDGDRVVTTVERGTTGGLGSSVDDYVVNLTVADEVVTDARGRIIGRSAGTDGGDADDTNEGADDTDATEDSEDAANANDTQTTADTDTTRQ